MSTNYVVGVRIDGNAASYLRATQQAQQGTRAFVNSARAEFQRLKSFMQSTQGQLAGLGLSVGLVQMQRNAAMLEKKLTQVRLTAGMSIAEQKEAYEEMFALIRKNGGAIDDTVAGYNNLIQAGLKHKEALEATKAVSMAKAVTGANEDSLSGALSVGAANYNFDLAKAGVATSMLDRMTVAGRLGNAELENLSTIFPRVASRAQSAGMSFDKTLAFIEGLSQIERQPERLATLADSTLRLFTNSAYAKDAEKATGVKFFAKDGSRRDSIAVLEDMRKGFVKLTTDAQRFQYINKAFGKTDLDTQRGIFALLNGNSLGNIRKFEEEIKNAGGTLQRDLPAAINNAADQTSRLQGALRKSAEEFARPINETISNAIKYLLNAKAQGGMELSGGQIAGGAAAGAAGVYALSRIVPGVVGRLIGRTGGVAAGVAQGKALQAAAGVTPVYVTNWAEMNGGGGSALGVGGAAAGGAAAVSVLTRLKTIAALAPLALKSSAGVAGLGYTAGAVGVAGAAGYGVGTGIYKYGLEGNKGGEGIGELVARFMSLFGNEEAKRAVAINDALKNSKVGGEITIRVQGNPNLAVQAEAKPFTGTKMNALGQTMRGTGE
ncbi:MAG: phage tail tape measure protein [Hydrogenophaga sp.]|nr:phage tail tape measure protein [Hydrogenophaga sp.]